MKMPTLTRNGKRLHDYLNTSDDDDETGNSIYIHISTFILLKWFFQSFTL